MRIDPRVIRDLREAGYEVVPRSHIRTFHAQSAIDDLELTCMEASQQINVKNMIKTDMIRALASELMRNDDMLRIVEHAPNPSGADPFMRTFRTDLTLLLPKYY